MALRSAALALALPFASSLVLPQPTDMPPVLNSPVYSLATLNADGSTNMQILTYATPIGVNPRVWAISLYRPTLTHANWLERKTGVLQLLTEPHAPIVYSLGGRSGRDDDKAAVCAAAGFEWMEAWSWPDRPDGTSQVRLLPGCATYLRLVQMGEVQNLGGEHDLVVCRVEAMLAPPEGAGPTMDEALSSARLRELGIITDRGKAVEPECDVEE